jgi:hypothetical protein
MTANSQPGRGPADGPGSTAVPADVFGRRAELSEIQRFLASPGTTPGALVLEGEAGIGKTTLWRHGVAGARERSWRVLSCAPAGSEVSLSFAALADLLGEALDEVGPSLPAPQRRGLRSHTYDPNGPVALARFRDLRQSSAQASCRNPSRMSARRS